MDRRPTTNGLGRQAELHDPVRGGIAAPAETAATQQRVDLDLLRFESQYMGRDELIGRLELGTRPYLGAVGPQLHRAVQGLHRRVRQVGEGKLDIERLRRARARRWGRRERAP